MNLSARRGGNHDAANNNNKNNTMDHHRNLPVFQIKSVFFTVNNVMIEIYQDNIWTKRLWIARSVYSNDRRVRKVFLAMRVIVWSTTENIFTPKKHYSSTSIFTVVRVCTLRTRTYTRINQSSSDETMMQQTTTTKTTQWIIMETYQYFKSNHCSSLSIM